MPLIKQRPSINPEWVKTVSKQELIDLHPLADEDYLSAEYDRIVGAADKSAPVKKAKK